MENSKYNLQKMVFKW